MKKRISFLLCGSVVVLGSIHACSYEPPTSGGSESASSGSSGDGGTGGQGQGGMGNGGSTSIPPGIACAANYCTGTDINGLDIHCCTDRMSFTECRPDYQCPTTPAVPEPYLIIHCDGPEDCMPSYECCGAWDTLKMRYNAVSCNFVCTAPQREICHTAADCPATAPYCKPEMRLPGPYGFCDTLP